MKIVHVAYAAPPDPPGGTEIYVAGLARALAPYGIASVLSAPAPADAYAETNGLAVRRFASKSDALTLEELYGDGDRLAAASFGRLLDAERPDIVHLHALTPACSVSLVHQAHARGVPVAFTYHTPSVSCQRGTLLRFGQVVCDGTLDVPTCTACVLDGLGVTPVVGRMLSQAPAGLGDLLARMNLSGGPWTALRMTTLISARLRAVRALFDRVDRIVVLTPWVEDLLRRNGVSADKLVRSPHGVDAAAGGFRPSRALAAGDGAPLRLVHLGRLDPTKGSRLLIEAIRAIPGAPVTLDVFGITQSDAHGSYAAALQTLAARDARLRLRGALPHHRVIETIAGYDMTVIPSQIVETGPLIALESRAAGVPILASALGGLETLVQADVTGRLVGDFSSVAAWAEAIDTLARDRALVRRWRDAVRPPRSLDDAAREMAEMYGHLAGSQTRLDVAPAVEPRA